MKSRFNSFKRFNESVLLKNKLVKLGVGKAKKLLIKKKKGFPTLIASHFPLLTIYLMNVKNYSQKGSDWIKTQT